MVNKHLCCSKDMIQIEDNLADMNTNFMELFICGECGTFYEEKCYTIDDEELEDFLKNYDELKDTKIYKEMLQEQEKQEVLK